MRASPPLRIAIIISSTVQPEWVAEVIGAIQASPDMAIACVIESGDGAVGRGIAGRYIALDAFVFGRRSDAWRATDVAEPLSGVARGEGEPVDLTIDFRVHGQPKTPTSRLGTWRAEIGVPSPNPGGAEFFGRSATISAVVRRVEDGAVLASVRTPMDRLSLTRSRDALARKIGARLVGLANAAASSGEVQSMVGPAPRADVAPPSLIQIASRGASVVLTYPLLKARDRLRRDQWLIAFAFTGKEPRLDHFSDFHRMEPPRDRFWADPFVISHEGRTYLFLEELVYEEERGVLAVSEIFPDGRWTAPERIFEGPLHLSFPHVFRWEGALYMVPETSSARTIELYRCDVFPHTWSRVSTLMSDVSAADVTLFEHDGRWWMYAALQSYGNRFDELVAFYAPTPFGPWTPHPMNPLLIDAAGGRPGGRPFMSEGRLLRAAQDGTRGYGSAIQLREIVKLTPDEWEESILRVIPPDWAPRLAGTHTLNYADGVTVIDGFRWRVGL